MHVYIGIVETLEGMGKAAELLELAIHAAQRYSLSDDKGGVVLVHTIR
jgi:hypothetical protein